MNIRILAQLDIYMYIIAYSEPTLYSRIFRAVGIFSQFQTRYPGITQERTFYAYSKPYLRRFMHT